MFRKEVLRLEAEKLKREIKHLDLKNELLQRLLSKQKKTCQCFEENKTQPNSVTFETVSVPSNEIGENVTVDKSLLNELGIDFSNYDWNQDTVKLVAITDT